MGGMTIELTPGGWGVVSPSGGSASSPATYQRLNRRVHEPLCLVLGALSVAVAMS